MAMTIKELKEYKKAWYKKLKEKSSDHLQKKNKKLLKQNAEMRERLKIIKKHFLIKDKEPLRVNFQLIKNKINLFDFLEMVFCGKRIADYVIVTIGASSKLTSFNFTCRENVVLIIPTKNMKVKDFKKLYEKEQDAPIPFFELWIEFNDAITKYEISRQTQVVLFEVENATGLDLRG